MSKAVDEDSSWSELYSFIASHTGIFYAKISQYNGTNCVDIEGEVMRVVQCAWPGDTKTVS
jgi:hypothetical protein